MQKGQVVEKRFRVKRRSDGKYWAYSNSYTEKGKSFGTIETLIYDYGRWRDVSEWDKVEIEEITMAVSDVTSGSAVPHIRRNRLLNKFEKALGRRVMKAYSQHGEDYKFMLTMLNATQSETEIVKFLRDSGFNARTYKKKESVIMFNDEIMATTCELAFTKRDSKRPFIYDLDTMRDQFNKEVDVDLRNLTT